MSISRTDVHSWNFSDLKIISRMSAQRCHNVITHAKAPELKPDRMEDINRSVNHSKTFIPIYSFTFTPQEVDIKGAPP